MSESTPLYRLATPRGAAEITISDDGRLWLSYRVNKENQGKGWGTALARAVLDMARVHGAREVFLLVRPYNMASLRVAQKVGAVEVSRDENNVILRVHNKEQE